MPLTHIKSNDNRYTVILDGQPHQFDPSHHNYIGLVECVHASDSNEFVTLLNEGSIIEDWSEGSFEFRKGTGHLYFEDEQIASDPTHRILECIKQGFPHQFMLNYLTNLYDNISQRAVQESYNWSSHKGLPITEDGMMIGYKGVRPHVGEDFVDKMGNTVTEGDLVDIFTGRTFRNNAGDKPSMKRRQVCDDHAVGCSAGLHIGTYDYACNWAGNTGVVVLVKFNPKDIVSVPSDCEHQKLRVSDYEVMSIAREQLEEAVYDEDAEFDEYDLAIDEFEDDDMPF